MSQPERLSNDNIMGEMFQIEKLCGGTMYCYIDYVAVSVR